MELNVVLVLVGAGTLVLGLLSRAIARASLSAPMLALLLGVLAGPEVLGAVDPRELGDGHRVLEETARLTLAVALMASGLRITRADLRANAARAARLLSIGMVGMWLTTSLGAWLLLGLPFELALLLGAILTPTDPVIASTIVSGPIAEGNLPRRLRRTLTIEAGANDGLALPLVLLAGFVALGGDGVLDGWGGQAGREVAVGLISGLVLGGVAGALYRWGVHDDEVAEQSLLGAALALALLALGLTHLLGGSGVFAAFVCALTFSAVLPKPVREQLSAVQDALSRFFLLPVLMLLGAMLPWQDWAELGGAGVLFVTWVLLLRRALGAALALAGSDAGRRDRAFLSWFGPLGVAAVFYATYIDRFGLSPGDERTLFAAATAAIALSIVVHSISATPGVRAFGGRPPFGTMRHPFHPAPEEEAKDD